MSGTDLTPAGPRALDAHGFDPADFEWLPVPRRTRHDGWAPHLQRQFIETLAESGSVTEAARAIGMTVQSCYRLRRAPEAGAFARAWDAAIAEAGRRLVDVAMERALHGVEDPVIDKHGQAIYMRRKMSDRLLMFLLRAHHPERYAPAGERGAGGRGADGAAAAPPALPADVAQALAALEPVPPQAPHRPMHPADFANLLADAAPADAEPEREARVPAPPGAARA